MLLIGDGDEWGDPASLAPAAVLIAITDRARPGVILTQRTQELRSHAGQIAFPGGRVDPGDTDVVAAALREAEEEIALPPSAVTIIGPTDRYRTVSGFEVTPVVGVIAPDLPFTPQPGEVGDVFEIPLDHLLDPANHLQGSIEWQGRERHYFEIFWQQRRVWGATAAMLINLSQRLRWSA
nr:CoA pyrophosphatase [Sphingomonas japonica]